MLINATLIYNPLTLHQGGNLFHTLFFIYFKNKAKKNHI